MKDITLYIEDLFATPMNTMGMGNVNIDGGPDIIAMSEPQEQMVKHKSSKKKKKLKSLRDYLIHKKNKEEVREKDLNGEYQ